MRGDQVDEARPPALSRWSSTLTRKKPESAIASQPRRKARAWRAIRRRPMPATRRPKKKRSLFPVLLF